MNAAVAGGATRSPARMLARALHRQPKLHLFLLLVPPLLWFGTVYLGSLLALLANSFYAIDEFTARIVY